MTLINKVLRSLEGIFGLLFVISMMTANSPSILASLLCLITTGGGLYGIIQLEKKIDCPSLIFDE